MNTYSLAPNGVFFSVQGEAHLRGFPMAFVRLAGCSVGCALCDTDYRVSSKKTAAEIAEAVHEVMPANYRDRWVWITGGEPYDRDLLPLIKELRSQSFSIAVATTGIHRAIHSVDWLSVSPHSHNLVQRYGHEVKLVDGLNGLDLWSWIDANPDDGTDFWYRYVQPLSVSGEECPDSLSRCMRFVREHPNWALSRQDHVYWGMP